MKLELCHFSGYKIHPGHGRRLIRVDGKMFNFASGKCLRSQRMRRNPRKTAWTQLYRRKHKKGSQEEVSKKRTRRTVKFQRAIQGTTLAEIMMKRNQKPEVRKAQREQAIRAAKAKAVEKKQAQRIQKAQLKAQQSKQHVKSQKNVMKSQQKMGGRLR